MRIEISPSIHDSPSTLAKAEETKDWLDDESASASFDPQHINIFGRFVRVLSAVGWSEFGIDEELKEFNSGREAGEKE